MASLPYKPSCARKLESAEALAMLQDQLVEPRRSTLVGTSDGTAGNTAAIGLQVSIKRGLLALVAVLTISVLVAITLLFSRHGVVVHRFDKGDLTTKQQQDLLEKYNSYSGTVAAAIERPLGLFVALMVDIMVVRFMADYLLEVEPSLSLRLIALALSAGFGYLLANGLSALNVQVHELPVQPVISAQDLSRQLNQTGTSTMAASYPDYRRRNPLGNTILRNLLLPRVLSSEPVCEGSGTMDAVDGVVFGFPQLPWMQSLLSESLDTKSLTIAMNDTAANKALTADQFPMNASVAAELLLYGVAAQSVSSFSSLLPKPTGFPANNSKPVHYDQVARLAGLISPDATASETADREWFLAHTPNFAAPFTRNGEIDRSLVRKWTLDLTHIPITPSIWVDAATITCEKDSLQLGPGIRMDGTRYTTSVFLTPDGKHVPVPKVNDTTDAMIQAFGICENEFGEETLTGSIHLAQDPIIMCKNKSASSMFLVSSAKRLIADAIIGYAEVNSSGVFNGSYTVVANLREVTLWTYARISWKVQNLAEKFGAKCMDDTDGGCLGLDMELPSTRQRLVVSKAALPVAQVPLLTFNKYYPQQPASIVGVTRPQRFQAYRNTGIDGWLGGFLLPHNVRDLSRSVRKRDPPSSTATKCISVNEQRLANYVNNHAYMDSTLQATYTAAVFFLFQNGVALDVVNQSDSRTTLAFSQNVRPVVLRAMIPRLNVWLTLAGCGAMVCALVVVLFWQLLVSNKSDPLQRVTAPHAMARVMVDSASFPSVLLQRSVLEVPTGEEQEEKVSDGDADAWMIQSIALQRKIESGKKDTEQENTEVNV